jgi:hypothetical protein
LSELTQGLEMLKAQADGLGMEVRKKDVTALRQHMYDKALIMGGCVDKAVTFKKTNSDNILLVKSVRDCIEVHLKYVGWLGSASKSTFSMFICSQEAQTKAIGANPPYDFLGKDLSPIDYIALKECHDRSESDKLFDKFE